MEQIVIYLLMVYKLLKSRQKVLKSYQFHYVQFHYISKDLSADNVKKTELNGYVYDFSVNYDGIAVDDVLDTQKCLVKKNDIL